MTRLHTEFGEKGLNLIAIERQGSTADAIVSKMTELGANYPIATGGSFKMAGRGLPGAILVGVDGNVLFNGSARGLSDKMIKDELKKIQYPKLKRTAVAKDLAKAAASFEAGKWGDAKEDAADELKDLKEKANKGKELDADDKKVMADAEYIVKTVDGLYKRMIDRAKAKEKSVHYVAALEIYEKLKSGFGKKSVEGKAADKAIDAIEDNKELKDEIKAEEAFRAIRKKLGDKPIKKKKAAYQAFIKQHEGTQAAKDAAAEIGG